MTEFSGVVSDRYEKILWYIIVQYNNINLILFSGVSDTSALHDAVNSSVTDGCIARLNVQKRFVPHSHRHHLLQTHLWPNTEDQSVVTFRGSETQRLDQDLSCVCTFVPCGLSPQDSGDVARPGVFDIWRSSLEDEGLILGCPPPEPDLKPQPAVSCWLRQTHVCCLRNKQDFYI